MAPLIFHPHHPLSYQCRQPLPAPYRQPKMTSELSSSTPESLQDLPLSLNRGMSIFSMFLKIRRRLWQVVRRVITCCVSVKELFGSKMFFFSCVGKNRAMTGEMNTGTAEALMRPISFDEKMMDETMKVMEEDELGSSGEKQELLVFDSDDEEEEDDEVGLSDWESEDEEEEEEEDEDNKEQTHDDDVDSEWSEDEDDDSEGSAESLELWESFFNSSDPYNPLCFSSSTKTNTTNKNHPQIKQAEPTPEECPKPNTKMGAKKVCFSDKVTVRPLVAWSFASRAARDGSCWMQMARDRDRFRRKVKSIESIIEPCLTPEHRARIWKTLS